MCSSDLFRFSIEVATRDAEKSTMGRTLRKKPPTARLKRSASNSNQLCSIVRKEPLESSKPIDAALKPGCVDRQKRYVIIFRIFFDSFTQISLFLSEFPAFDRFARCIVAKSQQRLERRRRSGGTPRPETPIKKAANIALTARSRTAGARAGSRTASPDRMVAKEIVQLLKTSATSR